MKKGNAVLVKSCERRMTLWSRGIKVFAGGLCLLIAISFVTAVCGQPAHGPPTRITAEEAAKTFGGPTTITLRLTDSEPTAIFEAIASQSGVSFDDYPARDQLAKFGKVSVDYQARPFWDVLRELSSKLDVSFWPYSNPKFYGNRTGVVIEIAPGAKPDLHGPSSAAGLFLVVANRTSRSLTLAKTASPDEIRRVHLDLVVLVDPKVFTRGEPEGFDLEIRDENGRPLKVEKSLAATWSQDVKSSSPLVWHVTASANLADVSVKKLQSISGSLQFISTTRSQSWTVKDVLHAKGVEKRTEEAGFLLQKVEPRDFVGPAYAAKLASWGTGEETDIGWPPRSMFDRVGSVRLLDAGGNRLRPVFWEAGADGELTIIFRPAAEKPERKDEPDSLVWQLPTEVSEIIVPFTFTDIPLP